MPNASPDFRRPVTHRIFGEDAELELLQDPFIFGGELLGWVVTTLTEWDMPPEGFLVHLTYVWHVSGGGEMGPASLKTLWRDEKRMAAVVSHAHDARLVVPVAIMLPKTRPPGSMEPPRRGPRRDRTYWKLEVSAKLHDDTYSERFRVPVEKRRAPSRSATSELYRQLASYELPPRDRPFRAGIEIEESSGSLDVHLTPALHRDRANYTALLAVVFAAAAAVFPSVALSGGDDGRQCLGLLVPICAFIAYKLGREAHILRTHSKQIVVEDGEVIVRTGTLRRPTLRRMAVSDIEEVAVAPSVQTQDRSAAASAYSGGGRYDLMLCLKDGIRMRVRAALPEKEQATRIARRLAAATGGREQDAFPGAL